MNQANCWDHKEIQASCIDVDAGGEQLALVGRRQLAVVAADAPAVVKARMARSSRWDVQTARWSPLTADTPRLAVSSGQCFEVYACRPDGIAAEAGGAVRAHSRSVADVDWSHFDACLLATSAVDDAVNVWDLRDLKRPSTTLQLVAGATQVKFCRLMEYLLATAHDGVVRVWDIRKLACPMQYVAAHLSKIHSLDWHTVDDVTFLTASQDQTVKVWDFPTPTRPRLQFYLATPAWKLRVSPCGGGFVTLPVPSGGRRRAQLSVWRAADASPAAVQQLDGHTDVVVDACWRPRRPADAFLHLFSMAKNHVLRAWSVNAKLFTAQPMDGASELDDSGEQLADLDAAPVAQSFSVESNLDVTQELSAVNRLQVDALKIVHVDYERGSVLVSARAQSHALQLTVRFPENYPTNNQLLFECGTATSLSAAARRRLLDALKQRCNDAADRGSLLLAYCLEALPLIVHQLAADEGDDGRRGASQFSASKQTYLDPRVPFPRTSGAKFNSVGVLVCFGRVEVKRGGWQTHSAATPRSIRALATTPLAANSYLRSRPTEVTVRQYYIPGYADRSQDADSSDIKVMPMVDQAIEGKFSVDVDIFDVGALLPVSRDLAVAYDLSGGSCQETCRRNGEAAAACGRDDLAKLWSLLSLSTDESLKPSLDPDREMPWAQHPFGRQLALSVLDHCGRSGDVQTAAAVACALGTRSRHRAQPPRVPRFPSATRAGSSCSSAGSDAGAAGSYNTVHAAPDSLPDNWATAMQHRQRSNSADFDQSPPVSPTAPTRWAVEAREPLSQQDVHDRCKLLLDPDLTARLEGVKAAYADVLYRWRLLDKSAEVIKYSQRRVEYNAGPEYITMCRACNGECRGAQCLDERCLQVAFHCVVCQQAVRGSTLICPSCGHGGHLQHMLAWFDSSPSCPTGCGCICSKVWL